MSYSICRVSKVKASGVTGIQIHDQREKNGISHTNEDIDWTKTEQNISLLEQQERFRTVVANRIAELELKRQPRSDATVMCQCLVTSDKEFFDKMSRQEQTEYFKHSLDFIKERYGEKNLVSATIHYDERTPHMHVNFVPVTSDGRLSAKDLFSPKSLRVLQDDYNRFVREQGYNLDRGDIGSKTKHLEVEEYKLTTRYDKLKEKELELDKLEQVDKKVNLDAEKGKFTYSTKEVEEIKKQNKALKIDSYRKENIIDQLETKLSQAEKRLIKVQSELEGTKEPIERLKDLENENRALEQARKVNETLDKSMKGYDTLKQQAYEMGNRLLQSKQVYHACLIEREKLIKQTNAYENMAKDCVSKANNLLKLEKDISESWNNERALKTELEGYKGIFKKKAREDCQQRLDEQIKKSEKYVRLLKSEHDTNPEYISSKLQNYDTQRKNFLMEKSKTIDKTNSIEEKREQAIHYYKYNKGLAETQSKDFKEISNRLSEKEVLTTSEERIFRLTQDDRTQLLKEYETKGLPKEVIEKCQANFKSQDIQEREERNQSQNRGGQSRTHHDYSRGR